MSVFNWGGLGLAWLYGALSAWAGLWQLRRGEIRTLSATGLLLCGLLLVVGSVASLRIQFVGLFLLVILVLLQAIAVANGFQLYGRIQIQHHLVRLVVSLLIAVALIG